MGGAGQMPRHRFSSLSRCTSQYRYCYFFVFPVNAWRSPKDDGAHFHPDTQETV